MALVMIKKHVLMYYKPLIWIYDLLIINNAIVVANYKPFMNGDL